MMHFLPLGSWTILPIDESGDDDSSSGAKRSIIVAIAIVATLISGAAVIALTVEPNLIHGSLTKDLVLKSTDLMSNIITNNGSWSQTSISTKYYDFLNLDSSPAASQLSTESSSSIMTFTNSTMNIYVIVSLTEFRNGEAAKDQFLQDTRGNNGTIVGTLNGIENLIIPVERTGNSSADIFQTIFFCKGNVEGTVYIAGEGLEQGNYPFLTGIAALQVNRI